MIVGIRGANPVAISVRLPTVLRPHANGETYIDVAGRTVGEAFADLLDRYPAMRQNILDDDGNLHRFVNVYVNDEDVRYLAGPDTSVAPGDKMSILPAVAGG